MNPTYPFLPEIVKKYQQTDTDYRFLVGIVGAPASGKSTLAEQLPPIINEQLGAEVAASFNMDAYHFHNDFLHKRGTYPHKGSHFTFDVEGFMAKLMEIKEKKTAIKCPIYDRSKSENPIQDAHIIEPHHKMVIVEGNYLLLTIHPWNYIRYILNYCIFLDVEAGIQFDRLIERHTKSGKSPQKAKEKIYRTDLPNAQLIEKDKLRADYIFRPEVNFNH